MRSYIKCKLDECVGCGKCIGVCPVDEANVASFTDGRRRIDVDSDKCIICGACLRVCPTHARIYEDDAAEFFAALDKGDAVSVLCSPTVKIGVAEWGRVAALLKELGVRSIYNVTFGADICTWAHVRYIERYGASPLITQPCPAPVNYILRHKHELLANLSPIQSPMYCLATYLQKYQGVTDTLAAISPCIAKTGEFATVGRITYNTTYGRLSDYIEGRAYTLPDNEAGFDHIDSGTGAGYAVPGGLTDKVEAMLGKRLKVYSASGPAMYGHLDDYSAADAKHLPDILDVLNCQDGCILGTGGRAKDFYELNSAMAMAKAQNVERDMKTYFDKVFSEFDSIFDLDDFIRVYEPLDIERIPFDEAAVDKALCDMGRSGVQYNCGACGASTCRDMAVRIAKGIDNARSCRVK